jgi:GntR family phosphonate transport system transcriptional regulator
LQSPINYAIKSTTRFTETLESLGRRTVSRIISRERITARESVAKRLRIPKNSTAVHIKTMREVDGSPFCRSSHFFPYPDYEAVIDEYTGGSLHSFIFRHYEQKLKRILSLVSSVMPSKEDARRLNLPRSIPVLRVKSLNVGAGDGWPVEYVITYFRGDAVQLLVEP